MNSHRLALVAVLLGLCLFAVAAWLVRQTSDRSGTVPVLAPELPPAVPQTFDGQRAFEHVEAQMAMGSRPTGSEAHWQTGDYILANLQAAGWETEVQAFSYQGVLARNIVGRSAHSVGPDTPILLLGAHYDTRLLADQDPSQPEAAVPGANDGASGVAVLLELAAALDLDTIEGQVWLVFFDAEDNGNIDGWEWIVGSTYFVDQLAVEPTLAIIADMVGDADQQLYYERNSDAALSEALWDTASKLGYGDVFVSEYRFSMLDDHTPFLQRGIAAVDVIDFDYPHWHTVEDTLDKVSWESLERVGRTIETFLEDERWQAVSSG